MSNQDIDGKLPPEGAPGAAAAPGTPETLEQQLAREREARALMRDRLRHTEALAAESHALRARMAQELEKVTADRDRLRTGAASTPAATGPAAPRTAEPLFTPTMAPPMTPRPGDAPLKPPSPPSRKGPWLSLAMLGVVAAVVAGVAWYTGSLPGGKAVQAAASPAAPAPVVAANNAASPSAALATATPPAASTAVAAIATVPASPGAVALPPMTPEAQLAAAPPAAGPAVAAAPPEMPVRLRKALDGEGIAAQVDVDAASGHVMVADPQADAALRDRTDMVIRAVYAGASLPEPQIEHRWLSPKHGVRTTPVATAAPSPEPSATLSPAAAYAARHAATEHHKKTAEVTVADAEELRPVLPSGRITESCMAGLAGKAAARRANMTACMKRSCGSSAAAHNSEECRAYDKAYPFSAAPG